MSTKKTLTAGDSRALARILDLSEAERTAIEFRLELAGRIAIDVRRTGVTHAQLALLAGTSRPRLTAILNGNLIGVSTDLLLRILGALGVRVELKFRRAA